MLCSNEDFENFYVRYKAEGLPRNLTVKAFCLKNKVPWNLFDKWYRDTRHRIEPVKVEGLPGNEPEATSEQEWTDNHSGIAPASFTGGDPEEKSGNESVRIKVDIRISNGMQVRQNNLNYRGLMALVEKLEE